MTTRQIFTTPVGRLVRGSLYQGQDKDAEGNPLVVKTGVDKGKPRVDYFFALAIPKAGEQHWSQTAWGAIVWQVGHTCWPNGQAQAPGFSWKIVDGDSAVPNKRGKKPCDQPGYKGHWILHFSSGFAPRIFNANGTAPVTEPGAVKLGYFIQVNASVDGNESATQPGVYLNHNMVAFSAYGEEIVLGPDPTQAGFGQSPLPAGASAAPIGAMPAGAVPPPVVAPPAAVPPPVAVAPNPAFTAVPPPVAPAAPVRQMTAKANGFTYEQLIAAGWTDQTLVQHGMMAP